MNLIKCFQTHSTWYQGARTNSKPVGILWHDTGAGNPNLWRYVQPYEGDPNYDEMIALLGKNKWGNDWNHIDHEAGLNAWIGKLADGSIATIQAGEWTTHPWGCGGGDKGSCNGYIRNNGVSTWINRHWIQFEICDDRYVSESYFDSVYKEACELTAYLCKMFDIDPNGTVEFNGITVPTILCHQDSYQLGLGCDHGDVYGWFNKFGYTMQTVRRDVTKLMGGIEMDSFKVGDLVRITGKTYYTGEYIPEFVRKQNWYVYSVDAKNPDRIVINENEDHTMAIMSAVAAGDLELVQPVDGGDDTPDVPDTPTEGKYIKTPEDAVAFLNDAIDLILKKYGKGN